MTTRPRVGVKYQPKNRADGTTRPRFEIFVRNGDGDLIAAPYIGVRDIYRLSDELADAIDAMETERAAGGRHDTHQQPR